MRHDLSVQAKQSFQVVALLATILVVGIHYQSDVPDGPNPRTASWNELVQEFVFGGIGRVAVPMFALAAGLFYFRSHDGSSASYRRKIRQRSRTLALPYFLVASVSTASWLAGRHLQGDPVELSTLQLLEVWILRPPAEQLWFLRDLIVLVLIAPVIWRCCRSRRWGPPSLAAVTIAWALNWQLLPIVGGWHLLHVETLLFFSVGCLAASRMEWIETLGRMPRSVFAATCAAWWGLIAARIIMRADFAIWYASDYGLPDLLLHQASIVVGCGALLMMAWRLGGPRLIRLSGASFFVYLVHEFPLRAVVEPCCDRLVGHSASCWLALPLVLAGCFTAALVCNRYLPTMTAIATGGRTVEKASWMASSPSILESRAVVANSHGDSGASA